VGIIKGLLFVTDRFPFWNRQPKISGNLFRQRSGNYAIELKHQKINNILGKFLTIDETRCIIIFNPWRCGKKLNMKKRWKERIGILTEPSEKRTMEALYRENTRK